MRISISILLSIILCILSINSGYGQNMKKYKNILSPALLEEVRKFESYTDSLEKHENYLKKSIIFIDIISKGNDCNLVIGKHMVYYSNEMTGYLQYGSKLLVFYSVPDTCNCNFINTRKLKKGKPNKRYPDENSFEALSTEFDPWGRRFKITKNNDLVLIKQGML